MKAPKISQTVALVNPETAQAKAWLVALKPSLASCSGENSTQRESSATKVTPTSPMTAPGRGSRIRPTTQPKKMAKKYQAWGGSPAGVGSRAITSVVASGASSGQRERSEALRFMATSR